MKIRSLVVAAILGAAFVQTQALADGTIAIAQTSDDRGMSIGVCYNFDSRAEADAEAIRQCRQSENSYPLGQRARCEVVASYDNQCMALAKDPSDDGTAWGWGSNDYQADADSRALSECRANAGGRANRCRITMRHCDGSAASGK